VGGTEFNDTASPSTYWNASNNSNLASAKGSIAEIAWNESSYTAGASGNSLYAGGGGASTVWARPSWQTGPGVPSGTMRLVPDVALSAAGHDGYVVEQEGELYLVGGTSASTPSFAGLMAIVNQYTHATNGNPNSKLYAMAARTPSVFHDVVTGTNAVPCAGGSPNCSTKAPNTNAGVMTGYSAGAGYDLATGLGSVDAYALASNWGGAIVTPTLASLTPNPMTGSASSQILTINGSGFVAGSGLKVTVGANTFTGSQVTFVSGSQLTVNVTVGIGAQALPVQVTNPNGQVSNTVSLTVNAPVIAPVIGSISPNPMTASNSAQTITINGSGFLPGLRLVIGPISISGSQIASQTATQIQVNVITGLTARTYPVQVMNSNGGVSNSVNFQVIAPVVPTITSLSPSPITGQAAVQTLTINGTNFSSGSGLTVTVGATAYSGSKVTFVSATQLKVAVVVAAGSKSEPVQVSNPSGQVSNVATLTVK
jgi:subtilase family serine protease